MSEFEKKNLELYEREIIARERLASAMETINSRLFVSASNELNIDNIAEAVACLAMFSKNASDNLGRIADHLEIG